MNLQNLETNLQMNNISASHHSLHKDVLSTNHHLEGNLKNPSLTGSSQSNPLSFEEEFSSEVADQVAISQFADLKSNNLEPEDTFNETPISVEFVDGEIGKKISIPIFNNGLHQNSETVNLSLKNFTDGATLGNKNAAVTVPEASSPFNVKSFNKPTTTNVNNLEINIQSVGDDAGYVNDISVSKLEGNQYTNNSQAASNGAISNQSILQTQSYQDAAVYSQDKGEYLDKSVLPVQGTVTGGSEEGILLNSELQNNPSIRNIGFREFNNPTDAQQTWVIVHGWNDSPDGKFTELAEQISAANSGDRVLLLDWREAAFKQH